MFSYHTNFVLDIPSRLVRSLSGIRMLMSTLVASIPALFNIGLLLMLIFFIYAVIGMQSFGTFTKYGGLNEYVAAGHICEQCQA